VFGSLSTLETQEVSMRLLLAFYLALISQTVFGIVIEPDDYAAGTDLSHISPYVTLTSTAGDPVIAAEIPADAAEIPGDAAGGYDTKGLGNHIFGYNDSIEWWFSEWWGAPAPGLSVTFEVPVTSFSILIAELYGDAGSGNEPIAAHVFDSSGNTIFSGGIGPNYNGTFDERIILGPMDKNLPFDIPPPYYYYVSYTYTADSIGGFIIGGDSEPTHLDRLEFTVPEPSSALLLLTGLMITAFRFRKVH
jgi:hypothetical protein